MDSVLNSNGAALAGFWYVDLDDTYFRGGDVLNYFWLAQDVLGGISTDPVGMSGVPTSVEAAYQATGGMLEVSFLPAINWAPDYLARIAADPYGDLDPTAPEIAASSQKNCLLYVQMVNTRRRSGQVNRTSFMYTLDRLGYAGLYDTYDNNTVIYNGQIAGHADAAALDAIRDKPLVLYAFKYLVVAEIHYQSRQGLSISHPAEAGSRGDDDDA